MLRINPLQRIVLASAAIIVASLLMGVVRTTTETPRPPIATTELQCYADCTRLVFENPDLESLGWAAEFNIPLDVWENRHDEVSAVIKASTEGPVPVWVNEDGTGYTVLDPGPLTTTNRPITWWLLAASNLAFGALFGNALAQYMFDRDEVRRARTWG